MKSLSAALLSLLLWTAPAFAAETGPTSQQEHTRFTLVTEQDSIVPGRDIQAGILLEAKNGWHTYWENPGDAGMPTSLMWTLPNGFTASDIDWPTPQRLQEGPLVTYSYVGNVFLPVTISTSSILDTTATYPLRVKVDVLVCKDICVPESAELQLTLPVKENAAPDTAAAHLFDEHSKQRVQTIATPASFTSDDKKLTLSFPLDNLKTKDIRSAQFFPREQNVVRYASEQKLTTDKNNLHLTVDRGDDKPTGNLTGLLSLTTADGTTTYNVAFEPSTAAPDAAPAGEAIWFPVLLLLAVMGGLVLNLMPCVLPVLSLKALSIARKSGSKHEDVVKQGIAYTLGIMISFGLIAGVLIALRAGGEAVGWGYQMQSPAFVGFLIYLLFMVGLNLSGIFELPVLLGNVGGDIANESSARGSFFTGILATAVATPCTAPFMASAVGAALTMPAFQSLLIFEALGFGLALPFLLISLFPRLLRFLPKPGAWMDTFKQLLAFPMYASVIWLIWVLTLQTGAGGMVVALTAMLAIVITIWMKSLFEQGGTAYRLVSLSLYALILATSLPMLSHMETGSAMPGDHVEQGIETVPYSKEKLAELRNAGKPVLVDATAAWCITCQVNARVALHTERTMAEFKKRGITLMIADWTRRNDDITEFLSGFGFKGVPLVVFYPPDNGKPVILPQILTEDIVIHAITGE